MQWNRRPWTFLFLCFSSRLSLLLLLFRIRHDLAQDKNSWGKRGKLTQHKTAAHAGDFRKFSKFAMALSDVKSFSWLQLHLAESFAQCARLIKRKIQNRQQGAKGARYRHRNCLFTEVRSAASKNVRNTKKIIFKSPRRSRGRRFAIDNLQFVKLPHFPSRAQTWRINFAQSRQIIYLLSLLGVICGRWELKSRSCFMGCFWGVHCFNCELNESPSKL